MNYTVLGRDKSRFVCFWVIQISFQVIVCFPLRKLQNSLPASVPGRSCSGWGRPRGGGDLLGRFWFTRMNNERLSRPWLDGRVGRRSSRFVGRDVGQLSRAEQPSWWRFRDSVLVNDHLSDPDEAFSTFNSRSL